MPNRNQSRVRSAAAAFRASQGRSAGVSAVRRVISSWVIVIGNLGVLICGWIFRQAVSVVQPSPCA